MDVDGVSLQVLPPVQSPTGSQTEPTVEETAQEQPQSSETTEIETTEQTESDSDEMAGVIRNLLEGHFKGVADIRLRINHFEQLAIIASENLKAAADEQVASMLGVVGSGIDNLPGSSELLTAEGASEDQAETATETETVMGLHQEFDDTVNQHNGEFQSAQTPSTDDLIDGIENAFTDFIVALQDLLVPTNDDNSNADEEDGTQIGDEPGKTDPPLAGVDAPTDDGSQATESAEPDYQSLLDEIGYAFAAAIAELTEAVNAIQAPPELSEPSGNGTAYEKFLAVYNEMWGIGADQENTESSGNVNMTA